MQPGDTFRPGGSDGGNSSKNNESVAEAPVNATVAQENATWYHPEATSTEPEPVPPVVPLVDPGTQTTTVQDTVVTWTASEFIAHEKAAGWYVGFVFAGLLFAVITFLLTREIVTVVAVTGALGAFGVMATRHPRVLEYKLDDHGVQIGARFYPYAACRSFSLFDDGAMHAIDLIPMERFRPMVTVYFPPEQEEQVLAKLGENLAYEERTPDFVDRLMHRLRF